MKPAEKEETMRRFVSGELNILVSTTVIEVGVDVPNASLMVVEHAERFGLHSFINFADASAAVPNRAFAFCSPATKRQPSQKNGSG